MNKKRKLSFLTVLIVLALSVMWTVPVLADEDIPSTEAPAADETQPSDETQVLDETDDSAVETPVTEDPVVEETDVPAVEQPVEETPDSEATILEQLPENTTMVVLDENGNPLSLATQEAVETIEKAPDPQWCPAGVVPGSASCSGEKTSFAELLTWLSNNQSKLGVAGVIWVDGNYNSGAAGDAIIVLDGNDYVSMDNFALTINGGWSGLNNTTLNPNNPSEFNVPFSIINWNAAVTLNNLLITNASGTDSALTVKTTGTITVNNVDVIDNSTDQGGALLDNTAGTLGNIIVNDSSFNDNTGANAVGLKIFSKGTVTIKNVIASRNTGNGVYIDNFYAAAPKNVAFTGTNLFMSNGEDGIRVYSKGLITLANVTAMQNGLALNNASGSGAYLFNDFAGISSGVTITGASNFSQNGWDGLRIYSNGAILLNSITANNNGLNNTRAGSTDLGGGNYDYDAYGKGLYIYNWSSAPKAVTLTGTNVFNGNASNGLYIESNGLVTVNNLTADSNGCDALDVDDSACAGAHLSGAGVTLAGYGNFSDNSKLGLQVWDAYVPSLSAYVGTITLANLYAEGNATGGVLLDNSLVTSAYNVTLTGINTFLNNTGDGLAVFSKGAVSLSNLTANGNTGNGVVVNNTYATSAKAVSITGPGTYTGNFNSGLAVFSKGSISTGGITAVANIGAGAFLDNCWDTLVSGTCGSYSPQAVNVTGTNYFYNNDYGLVVRSRGAITITSLTSSNNTNSGVFADNQFTNSVGGVTFSNYTITTANTEGIVVESNGAVLLANVKADLNVSGGVSIHNAVKPSAPVDVNITGTNTFNYNEGTGLTINTYGAVTLNNITAISNGAPGAANGVYIDNYQSNTATLARNVTLNGVNFFNNNNGDGLVIYATGAISVSKITASFNINNGYGAVLQNQFNKFSQPVTVTGYGIFNFNLSDGLRVLSNGTVTLNSFTANNNIGNGVFVSNHSLTTTSTLLAASVNVNVNGVNNFNDNGMDGLHISSDGVITLNSITANYNDNNGLDVSNTTAPGGSVGKGLTLNGWNTFSGNLESGVYFNISGSALLNRVVSSFNGNGNTAAGISGLSGGTITLVCANFTGNEGSGYNLIATGLITLKGVYSYGNGLVDTATGTPLIVRNCPLP